jgi:hypothetical protein
VMRSSSLLDQSIDLSLAGAIGGESSPTISSSAVSISGSRTVAGGVQPTILVVGGSGVTISPEATNDDSDSDSDGDDSSSDSDNTVISSSSDENGADVHVISLQPSANVLPCYNSSSSSSLSSSNNSSTTNGTLPVDVPLSPIISITVQNNNGSEVSVSNLSQPITISTIIPISITIIDLFAAATTQSCGARRSRVPTCSWFDHSTNQWSTEGCTTTSITAATSTNQMESTSGSGSGATEVSCSCNHLTEFSILARDALSGCDIVYSDEQMVYGIFAIIYAVIAVTALIQISRVIYYTHKKCKFDLLAGN